MRSRPLWVTLTTAGAILAMVVGTVLLVGVALMRRHLLDEQLYNDALVRADVYERVYSEILADPELADIKEQALGDLGFDNVDPAAVRIITTNSLRWAFPPSTLHRATETFLAAALAYVRGDTDRIDGDVDLRAELADLDDVAIAEARAALASVPEDVTGSAAEYGAAVVSFADELADGRVPAAVPVAADAIPTADIVRVIEAVAGPLDADAQALVEAAVVAGNERDALVTTITPIVTGHANLAEADLRRRLEEARAFDPIGELADRAGESRSRVVDQLNGVRDAANWFDGFAFAVGLLLLVAGIATLGVLYRSDLARAGALVALGLVLAGVVTIGVWVLVRAGVDPPLRAATDTGPGTWNLPAGLRAVVRDVETEVAANLNAAVLRLALIPIVAGVVLGAGIALASERARRPARTVAIAGSVALAAGLLVGTVGSPDDADRACNGHVELCDRPYDQVVQAATHNAMSSPDVVQVWPEQDGTIREQLDAGIRTLLIDTHYWPAVVSAEQLTAADPDLQKEVADRVLGTGGDRLRAHDGVFLCHNLCAFGAQPARDGLSTIREFLDDNPDEVVTLIVQDETEPEDTVSALEDVGLDEYAYMHDPAEAWPTLGELIDRDDRLVVFSENAGPPPDWYLPAFDYIADTPFGFRDPEQMSCGLNRGTTDLPLFLMNHWVSRAAPDRATASEVNAHDFIVDRAQECAEERGELPNFVAVDFYGIGDTLGAVDTLNGLD